MVYSWEKPFILAKKHTNDSHFHCLYFKIKTSITQYSAASFLTISFFKSNGFLSCECQICYAFNIIENILLHFSLNNCVILNRSTASGVQCFYL